MQCFSKNFPLSVLLRSRLSSQLLLSVPAIFAFKLFDFFKVMGGALERQSVEDGMLGDVYAGLFVGGSSG